MPTGARGWEPTTPALWEAAWQGPAEPRAAVRAAVRAEEMGRRWPCLVSYVERHVGPPAALEAVELGCGAALYGLLLACRGARVTLVDFSSAALARARWRAHALGLDTAADSGRLRLVEADIASFAAAAAGRFDLAISLGTVEHYAYPQRFELCRAHRVVVRPGGAVAISVPNRRYLPHEALKIGLRVRGKWFLGYERGFTRGELARVGRLLGLRASMIVGTRVAADLVQTLEVVRGTATYRRLAGCIGGGRRARPYAPARSGAAVRRRPGSRWWEGWLDDRFGRDLTLLGVVPGSDGR